MDAGPVSETAVVGEGLRRGVRVAQCLQLRGREVLDALAMPQRPRLRRRRSGMRVGVGVRAHADVPADTRPLTASGIPRR